MPSDSKTVVLIADDEPSTLALLSRHLRSKGYSVLEAADGDEAWELAHEHLPHLVLLDVMMPGMSGWEVCKRIREAVSLAHTGVIMLTGIGETLNEMTSPLYGADAFVDKPFEFAELDRVIATTLERRRSGALGRPDVAVGDDGALTYTASPGRTRSPAGNSPKPLVKAQAAAKQVTKGAVKKAGGAKKPPVKQAKGSSKKASAPKPRAPAKAAKNAAPSKKPASLKKGAGAKASRAKGAVKSKSAAKVKGPAKSPSKAKGAVKSKSAAKVKGPAKSPSKVKGAVKSKSPSKVKGAVKSKSPSKAEAPPPKPKPKAKSKPKAKRPSGPKRAPVKAAKQRR